MRRDFKKDIIKNLVGLSGKHSISEIYFDWVHMMAYSISNSADKEQYDIREAAYLEVIRKYKKEESKIFAECFGLLVLAFERKTTDWLGEIYMSLEISNKNSGQFFTPYGVSRLMSEIVFNGNEEKLKERDWIGYYEPCCGAGSMILAFAETMRKKKYNFQQQLVVWCEDIDENCLLMAYVQLSLLGIKAVCKVKNSLSQEEFSVWYTPFIKLFPPVFEKKGSELEGENSIEKKVEKVMKENKEFGEIEQLVLF